DIASTPETKALAQYDHTLGIEVLRTIKLLRYPWSRRPQELLYWPAGRQVFEFASDFHRRYTPHGLRYTATNETIVYDSRRGILGRPPCPEVFKAECVDTG